MIPSLLNCGTFLRGTILHLLEPFLCFTSRWLPHLPSTQILSCVSKEGTFIPAAEREHSLAPAVLWEGLGTTGEKVGWHQPQPGGQHASIHAGWAIPRQRGCVCFIVTGTAQEFGPNHWRGWLNRAGKSGLCLAPSFFLRRAKPAQPHWQEHCPEEQRCLPLPNT